jgi:FtsH-binding integral membrane protein
MIDYTTGFATAQKQQKTYDHGLREYFLKIYNYMALALVVTGLFAVATLSFAPLSNLLFNISPSGHFLGNTGFGTLMMFAPLGIAVYFFMGFGRMNVQTAQTLFWVYAAVTGMSLASLGLIYTGESIARTFFICASLFGGMSIYGYSTNRDLTSMGSFMVMGLMGIILVSLVNMFFRSPAIEFATSLLGVIIFTGLIAWDTQKIKSMYYASGGGELGQKVSIMAAFTLYLDFLNLFLYLLRFFGNRKD